MSDYFITSDLHLSHEQEFLYGPRGFSSIKEMNEAIVEKWNTIVKPEDIIYNLGDIAMNDISAAIPYLKQLNGFQWWIRGNHDSMKKIQQITDECKNISLISNPEASWATMFKYGKIYCYLSHYPTLTANYDEKHFNQHILALAGHTHKKEKFLDENNPFLYNVCLDAHNCYPVHIEEIILDCRNKFLSTKSEKSE